MGRQSPQENVGESQATIRWQFPQCGLDNCLFLNSSEDATHLESADGDEVLPCLGIIETWKAYGSPIGQLRVGVVSHVNASTSKTQKTGTACRVPTTVSLARRKGGDDVRGNGFAPADGVHT